MTTERVPTLEEAEAWIDAEVAREYAAWRRFEARKRYIEPIEARHRERRREAERAEVDARQRAEDARDAKRAWRAARYPRAVIRKLDAHTRYFLLALDRRRGFAFSDRDSADRAVDFLRHLPARVELFGENGRQLRGREDDAGIPGASPSRDLRALAGITGRLGVALEAVDPPAETFEAIVVETEEARRQAREERAEREADERRRRDERARFGVELDGA